ncbi:hypothetical protein SAMN05444392_11359 [Seinonella peptonophila]|uniref:Uncharacterized protein n=1 Tax=Seinonella peptonophila TaxID=112248 RepID=A0A1M5AED2_9BACL|nr:hypothetical protein SAMN05444392_11359 [Seinonella peptonophila]
MNPQTFPKSFSPQHQNQQPGLESFMNPRPIFDNPDYIQW